VWTTTVGHALVENGPQRGQACLGTRKTRINRGRGRDQQASTGPSIFLIRNLRSGHRLPRRLFPMPSPQSIAVSTLARDTHGWRFTESLFFGDPK
jgi:hypothetical protein